MGKIGDKRTPKQVEAHLIASRAIRMENANVLAFDLLDAGLRVWVELSQISSHGDFWARVILDQIELASDRLDEAIQIAKAHGARVALTEVRMNQQSFTRISFWPAGVED